MSDLFDRIKKEECRCLLLAPHPDDDSIGMGGVLIDFADKFDAFCISSSGVPSREGKYSFHERNMLRIEEWNKVMSDCYKIKFHPINYTEGDKPPFVNKLKDDIGSILDKLSEKQYDYIFVPNIYDGHPEHQFVSLYLLPRLLYRQKRDVKIVLYEVWALLPIVTDYYEISHCIERKKEILREYKSQLEYVDFDNRVEGLNLYRGLMAGEKQYAEAYWSMSKSKYFITSLSLRLVFALRNSKYYKTLRRIKRWIIK